MSKVEIFEEKDYINPPQGHDAVIIKIEHPCGPIYNTQGSTHLYLPFKKFYGSTIRYTGVSRK